MADIGKITIRMPRARIAVMRCAIRFLAFLSPGGSKALGRMYDALLAWVLRGLKISIH